MSSAKPIKTPDLPVISIVTPSFNQAHFIQETIESILAQAYPQLEYFVIDGGSSDKSVEIIQSYSDRLTYWCSEKDEGQTDALSKGFSRCSGDLFAWVNSDDVLFPGCLQAVASCYLEHGRPDIIHSNVAYIDEKGRITRFIRVPRQSTFFFERGVWHGSAPGMFYKTSSLQQAGGFNNEYDLSMDLDIWVRMFKANARICHLARYTGGFRWHAASKTVHSLETRTTRENKETSTILNTHFPKTTHTSRAFWRIIYKMYQILNLNYLLGYKDFRKSGPSRRWQEAIALFRSHR